MPPGGPSYERQPGRLPAPALFGTKMRTALLMLVAVLRRRIQRNSRATLDRAPRPFNERSTKSRKNENLAAFGSYRVAGRQRLRETHDLAYEQPERTFHVVDRRSVARQMLEKTLLKQAVDERVDQWW